MITEVYGETTIPSYSRRSDETRGIPLAVGASGLPSELVDLVALEAGWDGYAAAPINRLALTLSARLMAMATRMDMPRPEVFPVPSGGVQLEWTAGPMELELEIEPGAQVVVFVGDDSETGRRFDGELPRDQALFSRAMANFITRLSERSSR
jgi:hypothetical protein